MPLPRPSTPRAAFRDLAAFFSTSGKRNYALIVLSLLMPLLMLAAVMHDFRRPAQTEEDLMVFGDILPENPDNPMYKEWQARKLEDFNRRRDAQAAAEAAKRKSFQKLADDLGMKTE